MRFFVYDTRMASRTGPRPAAEAQETTEVMLAAPFRIPRHPTERQLLAKYFRAFGDPTRLHILELLDERDELSFGEIVRGNSPPTWISRDRGAPVMLRAASREAGSIGTSIAVAGRARDEAGALVGQFAVLLS
jgi:hypothetical protein